MLLRLTGVFLPGPGLLLRRFYFCGFLLQRLADHRFKGTQGLGADQHLSGNRVAGGFADDETRRTGQARGIAIFCILVNFSQVSVVRQVGVKRLHVQRESFGMRGKILPIQLFGVIEQPFVHFPELVLFAGAVRGLCRLLGVLMKRQRQIQRHPAHLAGIDVLLFQSREVVYCYYHTFSLFLGVCGEVEHAG